jgi:oligopeptidase A
LTARGGERKPALFTHDEVITLFHEFGHGLHHMLTQVDEVGVSGISGVEWDAVELPSQFMENFCWEWDVLQHMTAHADTGAPLPRALFDKMLAAKNFQSGMQTLRQVEFSLFDMHMHYDYDRQPARTVQSVLNDVRDKFSVIRPPEFNRFQHSFGHIFAGGYAAGYYSYKWAEVLSADAYARLKKPRPGGNVVSIETGKRFQRKSCPSAVRVRRSNRSRPSAAANRDRCAAAPQRHGRLNLATILLRGRDPASGGARNPHVLKYIPRVTQLSCAPSATG